jgi:hypothetical protein
MGAIQLTFISACFLVLSAGEQIISQKTIGRIMSIFEIIMLICFGAAWPFSLVRSYRSRTNAGKSLFFLGVVLLGYVSGILHKIFFSPDPVIVLYILNGVMVGGDIFLYFRNRKLERVAG